MTDLITLVLVCTDFIVSCIGVVLFISGYRGSIFVPEIREEPAIVFINKLMMYTGILLFVTAAMHLMAVISRCSRLLLVVVAHLTCLSLIQTLIVVMIYQCMEPYYTFVDTSLSRWTGDYYKSNASKLIMDEIQERFECCGHNGPEDWEMFDRPESCCIIKTDRCQHWLVYIRGCTQAITDRIRTLMSDNYWFLIWAAIVEASFFILTLYEWASIQTEYEET